MISIITCTNRQHCLKKVFQNYDRQKVKKKELIIVLNRDNMDINKWKAEAIHYSNVSIFQLPETTTLGSCLNFAVKKAKYEYVAKFDDDDYYAPNYIEDSLSLFNKTGADIIGKRTIYMYFPDKKLLTIHVPNQENRSKRYVAGSTFVIRKKVFNKVQFPDQKVGSDLYFLQRCAAIGLKVYSGNRFNYCCIRRDPVHHTWKKRPEKILERCKTVKRKVDDFRPFIVGN
ncbi:glycosyltransferase [Anaerobacillus alkalilacustris]|uniref:glycosyltransferase n=1 Tax=Anaerobacillus alkalilacustris TaxID=393763 RepID=UPI0014725D68|nr:glycosyltransferase [Anaerobacillus alkalilacustris]